MDVYIYIYICVCVCVCVNKLQEWSWAHNNRRGKRRLFRRAVLETRVQNERTQLTEQSISL